MGSIFQVNESNGNTLITGTLNMSNQQINFVADPTSAQDAATKNYVDTIAQGITWKASVQAATTAALPTNTYNNGASGVGATLTAVAPGVLTIDGYTVALNDRVLIKNEVAPANNGIYFVSTLGTVSVAYVLTRTLDYDTPAEVVAGTATFVEQGTVNSDSGFVQTTTGTITIGTTALSFTQFTGLGEVVAGTGLSKSGNTISLITPVTISSGGTNSTTALANGKLMASSGGAIVESAITSSTTGSGNVVLAGSPTLTGTLTVPVIDITNTTNQLVLGTTNTTTISSTAPSASRTYTIPDAGSAANMILDQGNYTIGGTWTFNNNITLASSKAVVFTDNTTNTVTMKATNSTTSWTLALPTTHGTSNQFLQTDGSGNTSWQNGGSGTVSAGTQYQLGYYSTSSSTISGDSNITTNANNQLLTINGSSSIPSYAFTNGTNTGVFLDVQPTVSAAAANWNTSTHNVTATAHGLYNQTPGQLTTTGTLPSGLSLATTYYVIWVDVNTFALASTNSNAQNQVKIAFTTQGTGTHTFTPSSSVTLGLTSTGKEMLRVTNGQVFVGGSTAVTQPSELIHAEGTGGVSGDFSADIIVYNTGTSAGRIIASSAQVTNTPTSYLIAYGTGDSGTFWSGGPSVASAGEVALQNASSQLFRVISGATDTYFYNDSANATWHWVRGANVVDATLTNGKLVTSNFTDWAAYTPTIVGCGTVTSNTAYWRQSNNHIFVKGYFTTGTVTSTNATISLPNSTVINTSHVAANFTLGIGNTLTSGGAALLNAQDNPVIIFTDGSTSSTVFLTIEGGSGGYVKNEGGQLFTNGYSFSYQFDYPI